MEALGKDDIELSEIIISKFTKKRRNKTGISKIHICVLYNIDYINTKKFQYIFQYPDNE